MVSYGYNSQYRPPAPLVHVNLRSPEVTGESLELPALLDTAADRSVVPEEVVEELGLVKLDEILVAGVGGSLHTVPTYLVQLQVRQQPTLAVEVAAVQGEGLILLGRDVLNRFRVLLDGPELKLKIGQAGEVL